MAIQTELSLPPIYEQQPCMSEIVRELASRGFKLVDLAPVSHDGAVIIEADGIFCRA